MDHQILVAVDNKVLYFLISRDRAVSGVCKLFFVALFAGKFQILQLQLDYAVQLSAVLLVYYVFAAVGAVALLETPLVNAGGTEALLTLRALHRVDYDPIAHQAYEVRKELVLVVIVLIRAFRGDENSSMYF